MNDDDFNIDKNEKTKPVDERTRPKRHSVSYEKITNSQLELLRFHRDRTGIGPDRLLQGAHDRPKGLSSKTIISWLGEAVESAKPRYLAYVLDRWSTLPDEARKPFTEAMRETLLEEFRRTGLTIPDMLRGAKGKAAGINANTISRWRNDPGLRTVSAEQWDGVMSLFRSLPDMRIAEAHPISNASPKPLPQRVGKLPSKDWNRPDHHIISDEVYQELHRQKTRTGLSGARMLAGASDIPVGLTSAMVMNWLTGTTRSALPEHVAYVLARYSALPDR